MQIGVYHLKPGTRTVLEAYTIRAGQLDRILGGLTKDACARCPRNATYGCCDFAAEAIREMPAAAIRLQETESLANGGNLRPVNGICRYHTANGCSLRLLKSSSCLGHFCDDIKAMLRDKYAGKAEPFIFAMGKLVSGSLQSAPEALFATMDEAITAGETLLRK